MHTTDIISLILLITFSIGYVQKLVVLKQKNKINANVLSKGNKASSIRLVELFVKITSFLWLITWISEIIFHNQIASNVSNFLFNNSFLIYIGIVISALGVGVFILATIFMKSSWRVGIDKSTKTTLVTGGIYKYSRNPAFVGFYLMFIGLFLTYANIITLTILVINVVSFHLLILQEEKHLSSIFGEEYERYKSKVPRYIIF